TETGLVKRLGFDPAMPRFSGLVALDTGSFRCGGLVRNRTSPSLQSLRDRGVAGRPLQRQQVLLERRERSFFAGGRPSGRGGPRRLTGARKRRLLVIASRLPHALMRGNRDAPRASRAWRLSLQEGDPARKAHQPRIRQDRGVIVVCGEALIDMVVGDDGTRRQAPGGGPLNTARALARLRVPTALLGPFSEDQLRRLLADRLASAGARPPHACLSLDATSIVAPLVGTGG